MTGDESESDILMVVFIFDVGSGVAATMELRLRTPVPQQVG